MIVNYAIALAIVLVLAAIVAWAFVPPRYLPNNRPRHLRIRLHLRLHPGKGFAHIVSLHLRWGRLATLRRSARIRPALPLRYRILDPREHSVDLGRAHYRHRLHVPLEEHLLAYDPLRSSFVPAPVRFPALPAPAESSIGMSSPYCRAAVRRVRAGRRGRALMPPMRGLPCSAGVSPRRSSRMTRASQQAASAATRWSKQALPSCAPSGRIARAIHAIGRYPRRGAARSLPPGDRPSGGSAG